MKPMEEEYKNTNYIVYTETESFTLRIGQVNKEWDELLTQKSISFYFYITAWNPYSRLLTKEENQKANNHLTEKLKELNLSYYSGVGTSLNSDWSEDSFCVLGGNKEIAYQLGKVFQQNAIVIGETGMTPELLYTNN
jgi:hypothetical protein